MFEINNVKIRWYGHDTFTIDDSDKKICIDPYKLTKSIKIDIILISHNHFDHLSIEDLSKVADNNSIIISSMECIDKISHIKCKQIIGMLPYDEKIIHNIKIKAVPAYNINKINPDTKKPFHPKSDNKVGFLINIQNVSIYYIGDSDFIPEMDEIKTDVLLVPVSGTYVMNVQEAASVIDKIRPKLAIPMHYGTIVGSISDAYELKKTVNCCNVEILTKE